MEIQRDMFVTPPHGAGSSPPRRSLALRKSGSLAKGRPNDPARRSTRRAAERVNHE